MDTTPAIIVYSHLGWNWVYQRPQHLVSRLSKKHSVLFIEEPVECANTEFRDIDKNVRICTPGVPEGDRDFRWETVQSRLLLDLIATEYAGHIALIYTPLALTLARQFNPSLIVYDCMDELSAFRGASTRLKRAEDQLFASADLVFTGGPSLYKAKRSRHPHVHCFPSSVDAQHFSSSGYGSEPRDLARIARPRLGYCGVIDERMDLDLIGAVAAASPEWQIVMIGPVTKIDAGQLPQAANLHYLGQKAYDELPAYIHGFDVCLMPFARNESTRFISPTKTLEYMAIGKPIVSTPIADVVDLYRDVIGLGEKANEFRQACQAALAETAIQRDTRRIMMRDIVTRTSWDRTVSAIEALISDALDRRRLDFVTPTTARAADVDPRVVIVGAGPTGLSAAYHLGTDCTLLEAGTRVGGWCRSVQSDGFTFDYAGHIMFSNDEYVHRLYQELLGDNVHWQNREAWIYSNNVHTRYPFQGALYGLPPAVIKECLIGAVDAQLNALRPQPARHGLSDLDQSIQDCCADGILESTARCSSDEQIDRPSNGNGKHKSSNGHNRAETFEAFIYRVWGAGIAKHFAIPYNKKLWTVPPSEMETSWLGGRVPLPDLGEMIEGAVAPAPKPMGPNARFGYPLRGGFQALMEGFLPHVRGSLRLNSEVTRVSPARRTITLRSDETVHYSVLISTMPLPALVRAIGDEAPAEIRRAAAELRYVSVRCVHLGIGREKLTDKHWIYYPGDTVFHRIFVQGNASPHCNPPGGFGLSCEITYSPTKPLPCDNDELTSRCIEDCRRVGIIGMDDRVRTAVQCDLPYAYVIYDQGRAELVAKVRAWLAQYDILLAGRYSEWEYYNSDHAFLAGRKAAEQARAIGERCGSMAANEELQAGPDAHVALLPGSRPTVRDPVVLTSPAV